MKKHLFAISLFTLIVLAGIFLSYQSRRQAEAPFADAPIAKDPAADSAESQPVVPGAVENIVFAVPFTPQAPFAQWDDELFQQACEEASVLMAHKWISGGELTPEQANAELLKMFEFEQENYGNAYDTSAADTVVFFRDYFDYPKVFLHTDITSADIIAQLRRGNLVITPMDGTRLANPYYTPPGPQRHMLLIRGFNDQTQEFITNDPGTRRGEGYRYDYELFWEAIRDYPTGHDLPIHGISKVMIVVEK